MGSCSDIFPLDADHSHRTHVADKNLMPVKSARSLQEFTLVESDEIDSPKLSPAAGLGYPSASTGSVDPLRRQPD